MYKILTKDEVERVHTAALDILENVGVAIYSPRALNLLRRAGVEVDLEKRIARPAAVLVEDTIRKAPEEFVLGGRSSKRDLKLERGKTYFRTPTGPIYIIDSNTGACREGQKKDLENFARLIDATDQIDYPGCILFPQDVPPEVRDLYATEILMENTEKHVMTQLYNSRSLTYLYEMSRLIVPNDKERRKRPPITLTVSPTTPLQFTEDSLEFLMGCSKYGIPMQFTSDPTLGGTGPVTLAGALMVQHAEVMMGTLIAQLTEPGAAIIYTNRANPLNMRAGTALFGAIENGIMAAAMVQMARRIRLPVDVRFGTDSKAYDEQTVAEKTLNMAIPILVADPNVSTGAGELEAATTVSMEQLVIDAEIIGMVRRALRGIEVNPETLAEEVVAKVGPGGHFLGEKHTREHFNKEFFFPTMFDQRSRLTWEMEGSKDIVARAKEKVTKILKEHEPVPLDRNAQEGLHQLLRKAEKDFRKT